MLQYLTWLIFILSVALAAGSIVLSSKLRSRLRSGMFSTLLYYLAFVFTFGFYGIWGQVVIETYFSAYISREMQSLISEIAVLLGLPFLIFSWLMLIQFSLQLSGRKSSNTFIFWFLFLNISALLSVGYFTVKGITVSVTGYFYVILNLVYTLAAALLIFLPAETGFSIRYPLRKIIPASLITFTAVQSSLMILYPSDPFIRLIYILLFFTGNAFIPAYLTYGLVNFSYKPEADLNISYDEFCKKFEVSPREKEIIKEICNGLSNKEISEKLFISLQTVKDHTHRIYIKTNVKSRAQLMNLVRESAGRPA